MRVSMGLLYGGIAAIAVFSPVFAHAQAAVTPDTQTIEKARVTDVTNQEPETLPGTGATSTIQTLTVYVMDGPDAGKTVTFKNDYILLTVGEEFYLRHTTNSLDGTDTYSVSDPYRLSALAILGIIFVALIVIFGGAQGIRGFVSLVGSLLLIFFALIPGILHGYSPVAVSVGVASLIIIVGSYVTHGFNRTTSAAVLGMIATVLVTGALGFYFVHATHLSGYSNEEEVYLNFNTHGTIDMLGLLFGGIMIGLLGVLYDIAIGQAVAVEELFGAGKEMTRVHVYRRAIRIGREHIGALVNTLAIAYVGAALPLLLLVQSSTYGLLYSVNSELFATEIVRILIGSIGLILGVPITTLIASYMLHGKIPPHASGAHGHHHHH